MLGLQLIAAVRCSHFWVYLYTFAVPRYITLRAAYFNSASSEKGDLVPYFLQLRTLTFEMVGKRAACLKFAQ